MNRRSFLKIFGLGFAAAVVNSSIRPEAKQVLGQFCCETFLPLISDDGLTPFHSPYYVSPNGKSIGNGTRTNPFDLDTAVSIANAGETIICMQGIYIDNYVNLGKTGTAITITNDDGKRPIFVHSDGEPPAIYLANGCTVDGLWFCGSKPQNENGRTLTHGHAPGVTIKNCTFINFTQAITGGSDGYGAIYDHNRFINCGFGTLYHDIYVSHYNQPSDAEGAILTCPPKPDPDDKLENGLEAGYTLGKAGEICRTSHLPWNKSSAN